MKHASLDLFLSVCLGAFALVLPMDGKAETAASPDLIPSVTIGSQRWTRENLALTQFRNGDPIPIVASAGAWAGSARRPARSAYENAANPLKGWGFLYNFAAVTDPRSLCPVGWRVPNDQDWRVLEQTLQGGTAASAALKSRDGWAQGAGTNTSGFGALPAGFRTQSGDFFLGQRVAYFWSRDVAANNTTIAHMLFDDSRALFRIAYDPAMGMSVRCIAE